MVVQATNTIMVSFNFKVEGLDGDRSQQGLTSPSSQGQGLRLEEVGSPIREVGGKRVRKGIAGGQAKKARR